MSRNARARAKYLGFVQTDLVAKGVTAGTAHRATSDLRPADLGQDMKLSTLQTLAEALGIPAWALLHPAFNAESPPAFKTEGEIEEEIQKKIAERLEPLGDVLGGLLGIEEPAGPSGRSRGTPFVVGPVKTIESHGELEPDAPGTTGRKRVARTRKKTGVKPKAASQPKAQGRDR